MTVEDLSNDAVQQRRSEIVDAAERCARAHGLHQLKLRDVAKEAGSSLGNIYNYFQNKEEIVDALVDREVERFMKMLAAGRCDQTAPLCTKLRVGLGHIVDVYLDPDSVRLPLFIASESLVNPRVRELKAKADQRARQIVMDLILSNNADEAVPVEMLRTQIFLIQGYLESLRGALFFGVDIDREAVKKKAVDRLMLMILFDRIEWRGQTIDDVVNTSDVFRPLAELPA